MSIKSNVIDMTARRSTKIANKNLQTIDAPIVDMTERRNEILNQERRNVKRTILSEFIGACAVIPNQGLIKLMIYDISETGIAFDTTQETGQFKVGEEVAMRVYLNNQTYFPFTVKIANARSLADEGTFRHGGNFVTGTMNELALTHFVKFIETVSASLQRDSGDVMVSGLGSR